MKSFFSQYSYGIIKMFVNQFAISIFGSVLAMATASAGNDILTVVVSVFAILFYLFLLYTMTWEIGAKDKISVDVKKKEYRPFTGLIMALIANIPNLIIATVFTIAYPFMNVAGSWAVDLAAGSRIASIITEGMYLGSISVIKIGETPLRDYWWTYFVLVIPAIVTCFVAYSLGHKNFRFFGMFTQNRSQTNK